MPARAIIGVLRNPKALVWGGAVAISGAIVANALFLQSSRHPAPFFAARQGEQVPAAAPDEFVRATQEALRRGGYYGGPVDGLAGPQTGSAIIAFERIAGREVTGQPSAALLEALRAEAPPRPAETPVAAAQASIAAPAPDPRVATVQNALSRAAYGQIRADGVFGPQTSDAIRQFQADHDLPVTGEIDEKLLMELAAAGAIEGE